MYLYPNKAVSPNKLFNLFTRQPLLPLLVRILKEKNKSKKVAELQVTKNTWDLDGRLLVVSATNGADLKSIFSFLIFSESACFAYPDGTIRQHDKSTVFRHRNKDF